MKKMWIMSQSNKTKTNTFLCMVVSYIKTSKLYIISVDNMRAVGGGIPLRVFAFIYSFDANLSHINPKT